MSSTGINRRAVLVECRVAEGEITPGCAREIVELFADPENSVARAYLGRGELPPDIEGAAGTDQLWRSLFPDYYALTADDRLMADMLGTFLMSERKSRGGGAR